MEAMSSKVRMVNSCICEMSGGVRDMTAPIMPGTSLVSRFMVGIIAMDRKIILMNPLPVFSLTVHETKYDNKEKQKINSLSA